MEATVCFGNQTWDFHRGSQLGGAREVPMCAVDGVLVMLTSLLGGAGGGAKGSSLPAAFFCSASRSDFSWSCNGTRWLQVLGGLVYGCSNTNHLMACMTPWA